ncbi:hypothetical protein RU95_GL004288 [Enterococcus avium]|nr:hypothetical protein RU95_GL004288 [Enterococcus avium]
MIFLVRKPMTNTDRILKSKDRTALSFFAAFFLFDLWYRE